MNKWFDETFLPSLFERAKENGNKINLTPKQVSICTRYMEVRTGHRQTSFGNIRAFDYLTYTWQGRELYTIGTWANGCSQITFGPSPAEVTQRQKERAEEKQAQELEKLDRMSRKPERWLPKLEQKLADWEEALEDDIEDGEDEEVIATDRREIEKLRYQIQYIREHM